MSMTVNDMSASASKRSHILKLIGISIVVAVLILAVGVFSFLVRSGLSILTVEGQSMEPTLSDGDAIILHQEDAPRVGQIVVFSEPQSWQSLDSSATDTQSNTLIKRIAAVPGDVVSYDGKYLRVNDNTRVNVSSLSGYQCSAPKNYRHTLTTSEIMVIGDNTAHSLDSLYSLCHSNQTNMYVQPHNIVNFGTLVRVSP